MQRVKETMGEYPENKPIKISIKLKNNNYGDIVAVENEKNKNNVPRKKPQKSQTVKIEAEKFIQTPKHPRERKKFIENRMAKKNSNAILSKTFDFDPQEYLDKSLLFDLKKTSEEKIFDSILKKILDTDTYYIENREDSNAFRIRKDRDWPEKDQIIETIENIHKK